MIHFLIDGIRAHDQPDVARALFELGCRLNTRFAIHRSPGAVPADAVVVAYGHGTAAADVRLPTAATGSIAGRAEDHGIAVWAAQAADGPDLVAGAVELLNFRHERTAGIARADSMGRLRPDLHPLVTAGVLDVPLLENGARALRHRMEIAGATVAETSWPWGEGRYAVCLTHDVDGPQLHAFFSLARSAVHAFRGNQYERDSLELGLLTRLTGRPDPYWNFEEWMRLEENLQTTSTFFVYPGPLTSARRHRQDPHYDPRRLAFVNVLRRVVENGWEVGVHFGIRGHSVEAYREACMRLADLCAAPIQGSRAHYWAGVWNEPLSAWRAMDAAGVRYDASCSPQALGYRGGTMLPTLPSAGWRHGLDDGFVVLATAVMDAYAIPRTAVLGRDTIKDALARIIKNTKSGGLVVLDWHERALANVGAWRGFMQPLLELVVCLAADSACRFLSAAETARMWREHVSRCYVAAVPGELFL